MLPYDSRVLRQGRQISVGGSVVGSLLVSTSTNTRYAPRQSNPPAVVDKDLKAVNGSMTCWVERGNQAASVLVFVDNSGTTYEVLRDLAPRGCIVEIEQFDIDQRLGKSAYEI